jgi:hydrogenase nickel incorporation protein HypA/HybF
MSSITWITKKLTGLAFSSTIPVMHELPITESILNIALEAGREAKATRITAINLVLGDLTSYVDDSIQFYFDFLSKDTLAQGATLNFRREPAVATCQSCGHQFTVTPPLPPFCPACQAHTLQVKGGKEFYIETIEVEQ